MDTKTQIKALTVMQPWANLIADGIKTEELRTYSTSFRGPLVICSSKKIDRDACRQLEVDHTDTTIRDLLGCTICVVEVVDCRESGGEPGVYEWVLENPRHLDPMDVRGKPGIFNIDAENVILLSEALEAELKA